MYETYHSRLAIIKVLVNRTHYWKIKYVKPFVAGQIRQDEILINKQGSTSLSLHYLQRFAFIISYG